MAPEDDAPETGEAEEAVEAEKAEEVPAAPVEAIEIEPGLYPNMDFDDYARIQAINFSILSKFKDTAAHAYHVLTHDPSDTPAKHLGYLVHLALLEPQRFEEVRVKRPKLDRRTKGGKIAWAQFEAQHRQHEIVSNQEWDICQALRHSVAQHPTARELLYGSGASELTAVWRDKETGVLCKGRLDRVFVQATTAGILDLKTCGDTASLRNWQRSITNYAYVEQAAMYLEALQTLAPVAEGRHFLWLVAETDPPYLVRLFDAESDAIDYGYRLFREHLTSYAECMKTGVWPGYPEGVETVGLPAWLQRTFDSTL